ncbi:unnamed protein product [Caenorhabditis bovis]|uniref:DNTTIP1 dimerisation domain-containing protein n=1 Tax=Caenorhabditis bovis TaxID=2654633 RepID=A0A8S1EL79_9PELO|nr:unnamed protein product [Caenorhabditis bovis]
MFERMTGNGNGNKMNMRISILEDLLSREMETSSDGTSARVNSLKQVIKRNKTDMANDAQTSLDLMRRIFQTEMTREIHQIMDRHTRTTLLPAIENLRRNGHVVDESVINGLYVSILENAKKPFLNLDSEPVINNNSNETFVDFRNGNNHQENNLKRGYESDGSDVSAISHNSEAKRRRGRPRKDEEAYRLEMAPPTMNDVLRWNPERIDFATRFITASKVAALLNLPVSILFNKFPRIFRYSCDEDDKNALHEENRLLRAPGRCYLLNAEDAKQLVSPTAMQEIMANSFNINEPLLSKIRQKALPTFEKYKACIPNYM